MPSEVENEAEPGLGALRARVVERLEAEGRDDLAAPLIECGTPTSLYCSNCGCEHVVEVRCKKRYCPVCARMLAARFVLRYRSTLGRVKWPLFVTWTEFHSELFPSQGFRPLFEAAKKLRRQVWFKNRVVGGIISGEVSNEGENGWHYHLHSILDARWFSVTVGEPDRGWDKQKLRRRAQAAQREVQAQWELALGRPGSVQMQRCNGEQAAREILKYAVEMAALCNSSQPIGPVIDEIRRSRLVRSWGTMYGHLRDCDEKKGPAPCPKCSEKAPLLPQVVVDAMFRRGIAG